MIMLILNIWLAAWPRSARATPADVPILFRAPQATDLEYRARLHADEALRTPSHAYVSQHPAPAARDLLLSRLARAQEAFVEGSTGEARRHFQEVVALVPTDDWSAPDREIFLHAYLRLAQLENGAVDRTHWLEQALFLGPGLPVPTDLFPPPLIERYRALARSTPTVTIDPERLGWPLLLINGVACRAHECPALPAREGSVRVTYVSDVWQTRTTHVDLAELSRRRPSRVDWVQGSCAAGGLTPAARELGAGQPFFGLACESDAVAAPIARATRSPRLAPAFPAAAARTALPLAATSPAPTTKRAFYKSPWLWAGVGAVVIGALVIARGANHHGSSRAADPPPTVVYGFR